MSAEEFGGLLNLYGFIRVFKELLEDLEQGISLKHLIAALYGNGYDNQPFLALMIALVKTRNACVSTEDFDEADTNNERDVADEFRVDLAGEYGDEIRNRNKLLDQIRISHGNRCLCYKLITTSCFRFFSASNPS
jgi:hypothetical protein